jgi:response regulator RpfG family c-di-GMP phosphodiesterase
VALKILLIDPDEEWLAQAKAYLEEKNYEVMTADTGKQAQLEIYNSSEGDKPRPFFYVILNLEVQNHPGPQVMKFIKSKHPGTNVIVTLENDELIKEGLFTSSHLLQIGAEEVLAKPFEMDDLLGKIEGSQSLGQLVKNLKKREGLSEEEEVETNDELFTSISIQDFYPNKVVLFDVFVKIGNNRYVKILHAGDSFSPDRIKKYREEKNVKELFFHSRDRKKYIRFCNHLAAKFISRNVAGSAKIKVGILKTSAEKFLEEINTEGIKPQTLEQGKDICANMYDMIESDEGLFKLFRDFQEFDPQAFTHAYLVSLFASMIVKQFEWESKATTETVAMAALFHDIGKMTLPPEVLALRPEEMTKEQLSAYQKHPELGAEIVGDNKLITNSIKQVILQHHEFSDGSGFPGGLKDPKLLTLSKIVILADYFAHYVTENEVSPIVAMKKVLTNPNLIKKFNGNVVEKFMHVFIDPKGKKQDTKLQSNSKVINKKAS